MTALGLRLLPELTLHIAHSTHPEKAANGNLSHTMGFSAPALILLYYTFPLGQWYKQTIRITVFRAWSYSAGSDSAFSEIK